LVRTIKKFTRPFAIMKVGFEGYEENIWDEEDETVCHIMVRVSEELKKAKSSGKIDYYPFGLTAGVVSPLESLKRIHQGPVDVFFVVRKVEIEDWKVGFPDPSKLLWNVDPLAYKHLSVGNQTVDIPHPIRLWREEGKDYPVLLIDEIEYYEYHNRLRLDFSKNNCVHINSRNPIGKSLSGKLTFGVFLESGNTSLTSPDFKLDTIARATLVPPYYGVARP